MKVINLLLRVIFLLTGTFLVVGCSTFQFTSVELQKLPPKIVMPVSKEVEIKKSNIPTYKHGRFTVEVYPEKDIIYGTPFVPEEVIPLKANLKHAIFINYQTKELRYYRLTESGYIPIIGYAVMTPSADSINGVVRGRVFNIDMAPTWYPTENIRRAFPYLPGGLIPFGHPQNAMGEVKFQINWQGVKGWEAMHLHGTNGYSEGNFWDEKTFGCTRLKNDEIKNLVTLLGPNAVNEGIEIIAYSSISIE